MDIEKKRENEKKIVADMIMLYCHGNHGKELCDVCRELIAYTAERSDKCPFMENKTFCSNCSVHCYKPEMREKIREVMRYSGPRMIFHHPVAAIKHMVSTRTEKRRLKRENKHAYEAKE